MKTKVLTVRQPWATAILELGKNVENRTWSTNYRGELLIHCSLYNPKMSDFDELGEILRLSPLDARMKFNLCPSSDARGEIIGKVQLFDVKKNTGVKYQWSMPNQFNWLLKYPELFPEPIPVKGQLGLWEFDQMPLLNWQKK